MPTEGNVIVRRPPAGVWLWIVETTTEWLHEAPASVDTNDVMERMGNLCVPIPSTGTTTVPSGWTTGCPPKPFTLSRVGAGGLQVPPPSAEVVMYTRSNWKLSSNSV